MSVLDVFKAGLERGVFPGAQLAASVDGKRVADESLGTLGPGLEPVLPETSFDLASLTKPLATATLLGRLVEHDRLSFDDPIAEVVDGVDPRVTFRDALEHASGWPAHRRFDLLLGLSTGDTNRSTPGPRPPFGTWQAFDQVVARAAREPLEVEPRARATYSDIGFIVLGAAIERLAGGTMSRAFSIISPSKSLRFRDQRDGPLPPDPRIARTENCEPGEVHDENARSMGGVAGHAGLFGSARDVLLFCEMLVRAWHGETGLALAPETVRALFRASAVSGSTRTMGWDRPSGVGSSTGGRWPTHSVGHLGFTGTSVWIEPERALIVALVTNRVCPSRSNEQIKKFRPELYDAAWSAWS